MAHSRCSSLPLRLLSKRKKYLLIKPSRNIYVSSLCKKSLLCDKSFPLFGDAKGNKYFFGTYTNSISQVDIIKKEIESSFNFSDENLNNLKSNVLMIDGQVNESNFDAIFIGVCSSEKAFSVGKNFFYLLHKQGKCNLATVGKYFRLCYDCADDCTENDKTFLMDLAKDVLSKYPILDFRTCENMALGLSITKNWDIGLELIEMCKFSGLPSTIMYSALVQSAFCNKEFNVGWDLLNEMVMNNRQPDVNIFKSLLVASSFSLECYYKILEFLEIHDIHPTEDVTELLINTFKKINKQIKHCKVTSIHSSGTCQSCFKKLLPVVLSEKEFNRLRDAFLNPVLFGKDIFLKTEPQEFQSFVDFLSSIGKVDVVLDGLNIAYSKEKGLINKATAAQMVSNVVRHFAAMSKKVVVIGRKHMEYWPKDKMNYIKRNSNIFLAQNVSEDDPFLLYAAMKSGLGTFFVSRDQMRGHKFLLKNPELKSIFSRWQQKHQMYLKRISPTGSVILNEPLPYFISVQQTSQSCWHLPISSPMDGVPAHLVAKNTKWLCLS